MKPPTTEQIHLSECELAYRVKIIDRLLLDTRHRFLNMEKVFVKLLHANAEDKQEVSNIVAQEESLLGMLEEEFATFWRQYGETLRRQTQDPADN